MLLWRTFSGYRNVRSRRDSQRTRNLYYQNVANNAGAIHVLASFITQEEIKEALLAYVICLTTELPISSDSELCRRVEAFLCERFGVTVQFDIADAIESLDRLALWNDRARFRVLPAREAGSKLGAHWSRRASEGYHREQCRRRMAMQSDHGANS